jgi:Zn-dependent protease with chaperone function
VTLLQLALSRAREYDADLEAARLTGDPDALADALQRLERREGRIGERILVPHRHTPGTGTPYVPDGYRRVTAPRQLRYRGIRW